MKVMVTMGCVVWISLRAAAQLGVVPEAGAQAVFGGGVREVEVRWHNAGTNVVAAEVHARMWQASPAVAMPVDEVRWKGLEVLPGQTLEEKAAMTFPAVRGETRFIVEWYRGTNEVLGRTEVEVYPTNLLGELSPLLGGEKMGVWDPNGELMPGMRRNGVETINLDSMALGDFTGKLAIVGPFRGKGEMREGLGRDIKRIAQNGTAVVWILPPGGGELTPSFYEVAEGKGAVVVVRPELVANFGGNPESQRNLVALCKLAVRPQAFTIPYVGDEP